MILRVIIFIGLANVLYSCKSEFTQFHKCIDNNEYIHLITNEKKQKSKYNIHKICNTFEANLLKTKLLNGTKKQDYKNFILKINNSSELERIRKIINSNLDIEKQEFITSFKQNQNILLCMRNKTNLEKEDVKNYFKIIDEMQKIEKNLNLLLLDLINNFDDNFFYNKKNRCIILYQILYIYSDTAHFKSSEILSL